ncbi:hypothetical protein PCANC_14215 [Puccinia coronata f. sp. avenae]|uniref:Uncharacterized protein n=1 Tax=Puccinia coronata f. sp. avenae TaxID=200324 RepID=A0A2N5SYK5_9BASI|nr:hypothetical protein PCANC_14215 [Puccinia coronata f. sp. avenae]
MHAANLMCMSHMYVVHRSRSSQSPTSFCPKAEKYPQCMLPVQYQKPISAAAASASHLEAAS